MYLNELALDHIFQWQNGTFLPFPTAPHLSPQNAAPKCNERGPCSRKGELVEAASLVWIQPIMIDQFIPFA